MIGWKALKLARKYEGLKIRRTVGWAEGEYIYFNDEGMLVEQKHPLSDLEASDFNLDWEIVDCPHSEWTFINNEKVSSCAVCGEASQPKPPKLITWYRPDIVWFEASKEPLSVHNMHFSKSKKEAIKKSSYENFKVLKWQTIEAPENWSEVKDG